MSLKVRRVVTGHDAQGRAVVLFDGPAGNVISERPLQERALIWTTTSFPVSNDGNDDAGEKSVPGGIQEGTIFGIVKLDPGIAPRPHRTPTVDYVVVLSGRLGLKLDDGVVWFNPGDVLVQRGTLRNWINEGPEPVVMAVAMVGAKLPQAGGQTLEPVR